MNTKVTVITAIGISALVTYALSANWDCIRAQQKSLAPQRLVVIRGKVIYTNHPTLGATPATPETLIFQKTDCGSCYVATTPDADGNYKVLVGDGKYRLIVENASPPEVDLLEPGQQRYVDTQAADALGRSQTVFNLDVKLHIPR